MQRLIGARIVLLLSALPCVGAVTAEEASYWHVENGGVVAFDVEGGSEMGAWTTVEEPSALGAGYLRWDGAFGGPESSEGRRLRYRFVVSEPGNFEFRWRSRIDKGDDNTEHNDSWVRFPTGVDVPDEEPLSGWTKVYMNRLADWTWRAVTVDHVGRPLRQYFAAGAHEFEIAARSDGHGIDRVVLYRYDTLEMNEGTLDALPLSLTTTDPAGVTDSGADDMGHDGSESGKEDDRGDPVPRQVAGTCEADTLVLATSDASSATIPEPDTATAIVAGDDGLLWLAFDLSGVPPADAAELRLTATGDEDGTRTLTSWLGSHPDADASPDATVALGSTRPAFDADERVALSLDPSLLARPALTGIGVGFMDAGDPLTVADSGNVRPEHRPVLVLSGGTGFCDERARLLRTLTEYEAPKAPEAKPEVPDAGALVDESRTLPPEAGTKTDASGDATGGGVLDGHALLVLALAGLANLLRRVPGARRKRSA